MVIDLGCFSLAYLMQLNQLNMLEDLGMDFLPLLVGWLETGIGTLLVRHFGHTKGIF